MAQPPVPPPRRRRGGRGRGRGNRQAGQPATGAQLMMGSQRVRNTEFWTPTTPKQLLTFSFTPGSSGLALLDAEASKFTRYKIHSVSITYRATASTTQEGEIAWGFAPGSVLDEIKTKADILKLRGAKLHALWRTDGFTLGANIQPQPFLYCSDATRDGVAFVMYLFMDAAKALGSFQISYDLTLSYPNP